MYKNNSRVHEKAFEALEKLVSLSDPRGKVEIIQNRGITTILNSLWENLKDAKVQVSAFKALWALIASDDNTKPDNAIIQTHAAGIIEAILISMRTHEGDFSVQFICCGILSCLLSIPIHNNKVNDGSYASAMFRVIIAMRTHSDCQEVQLWGLRALYSQCSHSEANKIYLLSGWADGEGGLGIIHNAMTNLSSNFSIPEWACRLSLCLCSNEGLAKIMLDASVSFVESIANMINYYGKRFEACLLIEKAFGMLGQLAAVAGQNSSLFRSKGCIESVLDGMSFFQSFENVQVVACATLRAFPAENRIAVIKFGGVKALLASMKAVPGNTFLQEEACKSLCFLCIDSVDAKEEIMNNAVSLSTITIAMETHENSEGVQEAGCCLLASLAVDAQHQGGKFVLAGAVEAICNAMRYNVGSERHQTIQEMGSLALRNLSANVCNHDAIISVDTIQIIVRSMIAHVDSEDLQENVCCMLSHLLADPTIESKSLMESNGISYIILAMQNHPESSKVQEAACGSLWSLVSFSHEMKKTVADLSGIDAVMCAILLYGSEIAVLEKAFGLLSSLSVQSRYATVIADAGGISTVIESMRNNEEFVTLIEHGCLLLRNLALVDTNYAEEASCACSTILRGMREYPDSLGLQKEACGALWALAAHSETCRERILFSDGVDSIKKAMQQFSFDEETRFEAQGAISQLLLD